MSLDLFGTLDFAFIGLLAAALYFARGSAPVRHLVIALRLYLVAAAVQATDAAIDLVTGDSWVLAAVSVATVACALGCIVFTARRIARKLEADR